MSEPENTSKPTLLDRIKTRLAATTPKQRAVIGVTAAAALLVLIVVL